ncbi:ATP-binding cassette domain-containing protein [Pediococcus stilesii]|uniref:ATP-binding cassette domain-containing protein n=1 Tax=Pediococcus stilesii TaxID=331679 RepID=A0A5R9BVL5_9LACO|nr:ATP-binding cassette domain-containing protein [Pediococcus stilesii]TLQ04605.1 ATP-binding cassette domain-containing protein [Pediococcus stilesii]
MANIFTVSKLGYQIDGIEILKNIDFTIEEGEYVTISGPSGSGKSTFLRLLATLLTPTSGEIIFEGKQQNDIPKETYRREVSYCFQQPSLFGTTVQDNLAFPFEIRNQAFDEQKSELALESVDLKSTFLHKNITELSGGEKQRVALIRNLLFTPRVLLLDEVTTGLDADTKEIVHKLIENLNQKKDVTILAITHDESEISLAHRLVTIKDGRMAGVTQ